MSLLKQADFLAELEASMEEIKKQKEALQKQEENIRKQYEAKKAEYEEAKAALSPVDINDPQRKLFVRVVRNLANTVYGGDYRAAYSDIYGVLWSAEGYHPASEIEKSSATLLDCIQRNGLLPQAIAIARMMFSMSRS